MAAEGIDFELGESSKIHLRPRNDVPDIWTHAKLPTQKAGEREKERETTRKRNFFFKESEEKCKCSKLKIVLTGSIYVEEINNIQEFNNTTVN